MWEFFNFQIENSSNLFDKLNISSSDQLSEFRTVAENYAKVSASHVGASTELKNLTLVVWEFILRKK